MDALQSRDNQICRIIATMILGLPEMVRVDDLMDYANIFFITYHIHGADEEKGVVGCDFRPPTQGFPVRKAGRGA